jgi:hypothetical protein
MSKPHKKHTRRKREERRALVHEGIAGAQAPEKFTRPALYTPEGPKPKRSKPHHAHGHASDRPNNYRANRPGFPANREHKKAR